MKLRRAKKRDLKSIAQLMITELSKAPFNEKEEKKQILKSLQFYYNIGKIYLAEKEKSLVGVLIFKIEQFWEGPIIQVEDLIVKGEEKDITKIFIDALETYAKKNKVKRIIFITNKKAKDIPFYKKRGYKEEENLVNFSKTIK